MPKMLIILLALSLLCCGKDQQTKQIAEEKPEQTEQAEKKAKDLEAELEAKLRIEYEKRFGTSITDFELSTKSVEYRYLQTSSTEDYPEISITRTATGAIAKYKNDALKLEIDIGEWLDFVSALHKCDIKGKKKYNNIYFDYRYEGRNERELKILSSSSEKLRFAFSQEYHYSDWADFLKVIEAMILRIKKEGSAKLEVKLKAEYEKRFGMPMTDFEISIDGLHFQYSPPDKVLRSVTIVATRTAEGGAYMKYSINDYDEPALNLDLDLDFDIGEWLDFVSTLRKCRIDEWKNKYQEIRFRDYWKYYDNIHKEGWIFDIYLLNKDGIYFDDEHRFHFDYGYGYPPNWISFRKAMEGIAEKIREKAGK